MRRLVCLDREGELKAAASAGKRPAPDALLLSRLDVEQYRLELPPMPAGRVAAALRFRLGALYPGNGESARIDSVRNGIAGNGFLLFVMSDEALSSYRSAAGGLPLVSQCLIAADLAPRGPWSCVFWTREWASLDSFEEKKLTESQYIRRADDPPGDWLRLMQKSAATNRGELAVLVADDASSDISALSVLGPESGASSFRVMPLAGVLHRIRRSRAVAFPIRPRIRRARRFALAALAGIDALLAAALLCRYAAALGAEEAVLRDRCLQMQRRNGTALRLVEEAAAKEEKYRSLVAGETPDTYAVIAGIAVRLGEGTRILSLVVKDGVFRMEAEGRDALATLALLEGSGDLQGLELHQSVPEKGGMERFSISGSYGHDRG